MISYLTLADLHPSRPKFNPKVINLDLWRPLTEEEERVWGGVACRIAIVPFHYNGKHVDYVEVVCAPDRNGEQVYQTSVNKRVAELAFMQKYTRAHKRLEGIPYFSVVFSLDPGSVKWEYVFLLV